MTREEAIRKAAALLRLAGRPGTSGEAAAAAAKAQEIMERHGIERAAALDYEPEREEPIADFYQREGGELDSAKRLATWRWTLANGIAKIHGCYCFTAHRGAGRSLEIVGRPGAVESVRYLYGYLTRAVADLQERNGNGMGVVWRREFAEGAASEIVRRLRQQHEATMKEVRAEHANNSMALVRVDTAIARISQDAIDARGEAYRIHKLRSGGGGGGSQYNGSAREAGRKAGANVALGGARGSLGGAARQIGGRS